MENKQTERVADGGKMMCSIDWLEEKWFSGDFLGEADFQQAKEMHKQEIQDAYIEGFSATEHNVDSVEYYNETFNPKNNG